CLMQKDIDPKECEKYGRKNLGDEVNSKQASPKSETDVSNDGFGDTIKILPYVGYTNYNADNLNIESKMLAGVRAETMVSEKFAVGGGFRYSTLTTNDFSNNPTLYGNTFSPWNNAYNGGFLNVREIGYKSLGL